MEFRFPDVECALALMHSIADEKRSAFSNRLRHMQKQGFPPGTNPGRGKAAIYLIDHIVQLAIALEMNQVGLIPERAMELCIEHTKKIHIAIFNATARILSDDAEAILLVFDPVVLSDLRDKRGWDDTIETFDTMPANEFRASFDLSWNLRSRRYALINVSVVMDDLARILSNVTKQDRSEIMNNIRISAQDCVWPNGNP